MKTVKQSVQLVWATPDPLKIIERVGRICYKSEDKITENSSEKFVKMLIDRGHEAMIEHVSASFLIVTNKGISHEIVRHRIASFAQESTRYVNYNKDKFDKQITVIEPDFSEAKNEYENQAEAAKFDWTHAVCEAEHVYLKLIEQGISPQHARSVLPQCLKTEIVMTANAREWRHFLTLRLHKSAHPQIRELAQMIKTELYEWGTVLFEDFQGGLRSTIGS